MQNRFIDYYPNETYRYRRFRRQRHTMMHASRTRMTSTAARMMSSSSVTGQPNGFEFIFERGGDCSVHVRPDQPFEQLQM